MNVDTRFRHLGVTMLEFAPTHRNRSKGSRWITVRVGFAAVMALLPSCTVNPATGEREISLVTESQEIEMGRAADPAATAQFGGLYPDDRLQTYVRSIGLALSGVSERPNLPWSFKVVDHELINAFALPGGFIYVTRGIVAHMNSEAELAAVLGHEAGHVTARHTAQQITRQQLGALGLIGAAIFSEGVRENADLAMLGMQLALLRYGREAEREADALGFRYMTRTGHHPDGLTRIMQTLDSTTPSSSERGIPSWLLSHPDPGDRVEANERRIAEAGDGLRGHELRVADFLGMLDGLVFGEDPRNGLVLDERFVHPTLRFELTFPAGWAVANGPQAVQGSSPGQDAILELTLAPEESPAAALQAFSGMEGVTVVDAGSGRLNGLDARTARFTVDTQGQQLAGRVVFVAHRGHVYRLLGYALREDWQRHSSGVDRSIGTFEPLPAGEYEDVRPHRMRIVTLDRAMTGEEFVRAYPSTVPAEDVLLANQVTPAETLPRGRLMKQIVGGRIPTH